MKDLKSNLQSLHSQIIDTPGVRKLSSIDDAMEAIKITVDNHQQDITTSRSEQVQMSNSASKYLLDVFFDSLNLCPIYTEGQRIFMPINSNSIELSFNSELSLRDNVCITSHLISKYIGVSFIDSFNNHDMPCKDYLKSCLRTTKTAILAAIPFHLFILETISEGFSIDLRNLDDDKLKTRLDNGYKVLSTLSLHLSKYSLVVLDSLSLVSLQNPFEFDKTTDQIKLKDEVMMIIEKANEVLVKKKNNSGSPELAEQMVGMLDNYSDNFHGTYEAFFRNLKDFSELDKIEHFQCPAHKSKINNQSLFQALFKYSTSSLREYYGFMLDQDILFADNNKFNANDDNNVFGEDNFLRISEIDSFFR